MNKNLQEKNIYRIDADAREIQVWEGNMENYDATDEVLKALSSSTSFARDADRSQTDIHYRFRDNELLKICADLLEEIGFTRVL